MNEEYWNRVISNMGENDRVRFGITGKGIRPNYQIISPRGQIRTYRSQNHERNGEPEYDEAHITGEYTLADVNNRMVRAHIQELIRGDSGCNMTHLTRSLKDNMIPIIKAMKHEFDTHEFILALASKNQQSYIEALACIESNRPFQVLHSAIGKTLKVISTQENALIREVEASVSSRNIFGESSTCSRWQKML